MMRRFPIAQGLGARRWTLDIVDAGGESFYVPVQTTLPAGGSREREVVQSADCTGRRRIQGASPPGDFDPGQNNGQTASSQTLRFKRH